MDPPWSLRIQDEAPLTLVAVVQGEASVLPDGSRAAWLHQGDVVILRGPDHYTVADDPATPPQAVIHPGQRCTTPDGEELDGDGPSRRSHLGQQPSRRHRDADRHLPARGRGEPAPPARAAAACSCSPRVLWDSPLIPLLAEEIVKDEPGQEAVLDRLLDLLLIAVLRAWFARPEAETPAWYRAYSDPVVGRALRILQNNPTHRWTIAALAEATNVSRATLARRFSELVGEPPMAFLTSWRIALAADLLLEPGATIGSVAHQVGYGSPFALSTAFKRVRGISPQQYRAAAHVI